MSVVLQPPAGETLHPLARECVKTLPILDPIRRAALYKKDLIRLDSNTNPYGGVYSEYPNPAPVRLQEQLACYLNLAGPQEVLFTPGSIAALELMIRAFCEPGKDSIAIASPTFPFYAHCARSHGVEVREVPLQGTEFDITSTDDLVATGAKLIFLCIPNNPMGTSISISQVETLLAKAPGLVVVDEAYIEFSQKASSLSLLRQYANLVVVRTFSKAWGLAGLRAGVLLANAKVIDTVQRLQPLFAFHQAAQHAVAVKLSNASMMKEQVECLVKERNRLSLGLEQLPGVIRVLPSDSNFLLVQFENGRKAYNALLEGGILVADSSFALPNSLRISVGTKACNNRLLGCLGSKLEADRGDSIVSPLHSLSQTFPDRHHESLAIV